MARDPGDRPFVAVQWGTAAMQAMLVAPDGGLLETHRVEVALASLDRPGMADLLARTMRRWPDAAPEPWLAGMIGSELGWVEAPSTPCPASASALADATRTVPIGAVRAHILPGLVQRPPVGDPDRLRGEEVWAVGHAAGDSADATMLAVPGAHGKWIAIDNGRIARFHTSPTVEVARVVQAHAALANGMRGPPRIGPAFLDGVRRGARGRPAPRLAFAARAMLLDGALTGEEAASFLWGVFVGADVADALADLGPRAEVTVVGAPGTVSLFAAAIELLGGRATTPDSDRLAGRGFAHVRALRAGHGEATVPPVPALLEGEC